MTETPTKRARDHVETLVKEAKAGAKHIEALMDAILAERVYQNGVRGNAVAVKTKAGEMSGLFTQLRAAAHKDLGPLEPSPPEPAP